MQSLGREDPLEKDTATHSSILSRRILQTEEPLAQPGWPKTLQNWSISNLGDAVYRRLLEFASDAFGTFCSDAEKKILPPDEADGVISHSEALAMLAEYDAGFGQLLSPLQHDVLRALMHGGFDKDGVLLTDDARNALIGAMLYPV